METFHFDLVLKSRRVLVNASCNIYFKNVPPNVSLTFSTMSRKIGISFAFH